MGGFAADSAIILNSPVLVLRLPPCWYRRIRSDLLPGVVRFGERLRTLAAFKFSSYENGVLTDTLDCRQRSPVTVRMPERLSLLFGIVYLDRNDLPVLPGLGLIWTPDPDWRLDVIFPRPKLARRLRFVPHEREDWLYLAGSLGGRTWAVERQPGIPDQLTLRDYRLSIGWERIAEGGGGFFVDAGYVFGQELEYEITPLARSFDDALIIRGGISH